jgi:hypothetical protein
LKTGVALHTSYSNIRQRVVQPVVESVVVPSASAIATAAAKINSLSRFVPALKTEMSLITLGEVDTKTLCAVSDGREVPTSFNKKTKRIEIGDVGQSSSTVEIFYCQNVRANLPATKYVTMQIDKRCESLRQRFNR